MDEPAVRSGTRGGALRHYYRDVTPSLSVAAPYAPLQDYLKRRYADTVVLTFAEIEDLLGCALPDGARMSPEWWSNDDERSSPQSLVWTKVGRRATAKLVARTVAFERVSD